MSGIVAVLREDGAPIDRDLLDRLTQQLACRGPDGHGVWAGGAVGLGHAQLRTTREAAAEVQPRATEDGVCLTADLRLDGRDELLRRLGAADREGLSDADLLLRAYRTWGLDGLAHLLGDFAFVLWDGPRRRLFAARDHFGVKPFFYARTAHALLLSNTLNCLRAHPGVSAHLNDQAVGDFLLFGRNHDLATTIFADVRRLPPAHALLWEAGRLRVWRYWALPTAPPPPRRRRDVVEQFRDLFDQAVRDRSRTDRIGVFMSGGLDSTAIAATLREGLRGGAAGGLRLYTAVFDRLIADPEKEVARFVAQRLDAPIEFLAGDDYLPYQNWGQPGLRFPEPVDDPMAALSADQFRQAAAHGRVVFSGMGGDPLLHGSPAYLMGLLAAGHGLRWLGEVGRHLWTHHRLPALGLRSWLKRGLGVGPEPPPFPTWLNPDFVRRHDLCDRWRRQTAPPRRRHPTHAEAHADLTTPFWPWLFELWDPGTTELPLETRQPFFDVRLVTFVLSLPPLPWCADKHILREGMRGRLPEAVRRRPKCPLAGDPLGELIDQGKVNWANFWDAIPLLEKYVNVGRVYQLSVNPGDARNYSTTLITRPISLNRWFRQVGLA